MKSQRLDREASGGGEKGGAFLLDPSPFPYWIHSLVQLFDQLIDKNVICCELLRTQFWLGKFDANNCPTPTLPPSRPPPTAHRPSPVARRQFLGTFRRLNSRKNDEGASPVAGSGRRGAGRATCRPARAFIADFLFPRWPTSSRRVEYWIMMVLAISIGDD